MVAKRQVKPPRAKAAPKAPVVPRRPITGDTNSVSESHAAGAAVIGGTVESHPETDVAMQELVTVTVPKMFKLRKVDHSEITVAAGVQEMPRWMAEHWWSAANGVEIYKAKK